MSELSPMSGHGDEQVDLLLERLERELAVEPAPHVAASVRQRIAEAPQPRKRWLVPVIAMGTLAVALVVARAVVSGPEPGAPTAGAASKTGADAGAMAATAIPGAESPEPQALSQERVVAARAGGAAGAAGAVVPRWAGRESRAQLRETSSERSGESVARTVMDVQIDPRVSEAVLRAVRADGPSNAGTARTSVVEPQTLVPTMVEVHVIRGVDVVPFGTPEPDPDAPTPSSALKDETRSLS